MRFPQRTNYSRPPAHLWTGGLDGGAASVRHEWIRGWGTFMISPLQVTRIRKVIMAKPWLSSAIGKIIRFCLSNGLLMTVLVVSPLIFAQDKQLPDAQRAQLEAAITK